MHRVLYLKRKKRKNPIDLQDGLKEILSYGIIIKKFERMGWGQRMTFGEQLRSARKTRQMNQDQIADALHVSRQAVSHWESGRNLPDWETIQRLSTLLDYSFSLIEEQDANDSAEQSAEIQVQDVAEVSAAPKMRSFHFQLRDGLIGFAAGVVLCLMVMLAAMPKVQAVPASVPGTVITPVPAAELGTIEWFKSAQVPEENKAFVLIDSGTDVVKAVRDPGYPEGAGWFYCVYLSNRTGFDFKVTEYSTTGFNLNGEPYERMIYPEDMVSQWWNGSNVIPAYGQQIVGGGMPIQPLSGLGILLKGVDVNGNEQEFRGFIAFSQEIVD